MARNNGYGLVAKKYFEEALVIRKALVTVEPWRSNFKDELASILNYLGIIARSSGQLDQSQEHFKEALTIQNN